MRRKPSGRRERTMRIRSAVVVAWVCMACTTIPVIPVAAQGKFQIESADTIKSVLERQIGKAIRPRLQSGEEVGGTVTKVGDHVVHLSELAGREFFDAVVRIDGISAVILRTRGN
jgi:hypothetical protein